MKKCTDCDIEKPLEDFYPHSGNSDGRLGDCKLCKRAKNLKYKHQLRDERLRKKAIAKNITCELIAGINK